MTTDDDQALFRAAMAAVRPLTVPSRAPRPASLQPQGRRPLSAVVRPDWDGPPLTGGCTVSWRRPEASAQLLRTLRGARFTAQDEIDLHGMRAADAQRYLERFLSESVAAGHAQVRVIHGRGQHGGTPHPVIKNLVVALLRGHPATLAFVSAGHHDGGAGALRVRLREPY